MSINSKPQARRLRFSVRDALVAVLIVALTFGWYASTQHYEHRISALTRQLQFAETRQQYSNSRDILSRSRRSPSRNGVFSGVDLSGAILNRVTIQGGTNAFQGTILNHCHLNKATLTGSFQGASFEKAKLAGAQLIGGASSFQLASFVNANLSDATLIGGPSSFQGATFQGATLVGAKIVCKGASFQAVDIDAAIFQGADLSTIESESLKSCYFRIPPSYDDKTRFPKGFDPKDEGWTRA